MAKGSFASEIVRVREQYPELTCYQIGNMFGRHPSYVRTAARRKGVPFGIGRKRRDDALTMRRVQEILRVYDSPTIPGRQESENLADTSTSLRSSSA